MNPNRNSSLEIMDAQITRCAWCSDWAFKNDLCTSCATNGYPYIDMEAA